ncbi:hypothetical protein WR25_26541 isoform B [Diploscapter pachys]|uniref:fatty acid amide hydrolase n=2 Tax=Diploscapter pachys TaxID=2018661 RepID=A0A2A2LIB3_9BILA|nr:hypothetical protein WR25_26541 isoform B [Diploscapter pachys]
MFLSIFVVAILGVIGYACHWWQKRQQRQEELRKIIEKRKAEREQSIEFAKSQAAKVEKSLREKIERWDLDTLRDNLQKGTVSCLDVVRTFYGKAVKAHERTNCVTLFVREAEQWASEWDEKAKDPNFKKPSFFGFPISLKECVPLGGYDQTRGYVQDAYKPTKEDCVLVEKIKDLGFIPYVQTNVPQSLLACNCCNPLYGKTNHPFDKERTAGGSSGGESAILAAGGSLLGIGGDVGGSIRIPCHFTGMAGIKPSHLRFSHRGICGSIPGRPLINSNDGPMATTIKDNVTFLRAVWDDMYTHERDPYVPPVLWNEDLYKEGKKYRIGYYVDDGWFTPIPAIQRAVLEAKEHLERAGHTLVPFKPQNIPFMIRCFVRACCVDGGTFLRNKLMNDIMDPTIRNMVVSYMIPVWIQRLLAMILQNIYPRIANISRAMTYSTVELRETYADIESFRSKFTVQMLDDKIDALLCPPMVMAAPQHEYPTKIVGGFSYTGIFNLLDYGAGVVNVTKVTEEDERKMVDYPESDPWYKMVKETTKVGLIEIKFFPATTLWRYERHVFSKIRRHDFYKCFLQKHHVVLLKS